MLCWLSPLLSIPVTRIAPIDIQQPVSYVTTQQYDMQSPNAASCYFMLHLTGVIEL